MQAVTVKNKIAQKFNKAAQTYDNAAIIQQEVANRLFERLEFIKLNPEIILDIGAATGYCTGLLQKKYPKSRVIGIDIADELLKVATKKSSKIEYQCADMDELPFENNSVDIIFSNMTIQWSLDLEHTLREFNRVLKPNGLVFFSTLGVDTFKELREVSNNVNNFPDMHNIGDLLLTNNFYDPVVDMEHITLTYSKFENLLKDLRQTGTNLSLNQNKNILTKTDYKKLINNYEKFRHEDNRLALTYEVIYGLAWKKDLKKSSNPQEFNISVEDIVRK